MGSNLVESPDLLKLASARIMSSVDFKHRTSYNTSFTRIIEFLGKKTARKNNKYSRNERILKIGHLAKPIAHAKAIAFAKWSVWVKN